MTPALSIAQCLESARKSADDVSHSGGLPATAYALADAVRKVATAVSQLSGQFDEHVRASDTQSAEAFDCILHLPMEPYTVVVLDDATWSAAGAGLWCLAGTVRTQDFPQYTELYRVDTVEVIYPDKASECVQIDGKPLPSIESGAARRLVQLFTGQAPAYPLGRAQTDSAAL
jgi:hypothetical protein